MKYGHVLLLSAGSKIPFIKALKEAAHKIDENMLVYAADVNSEAQAKYFAHKFYKMPYVKDIDIKDFLAYCKAENIRYVIPTRDAELFFWTSIKEEFLKEGIHICVQEKDVISNSFDKYNFYHICRQADLPIIPTSTNIEDIEADFYVVKERFGFGSINIGIKLTKEEAIIHAKKLEEALFQPYIEGLEHNVDIYIDRNNSVKGAIARTREDCVDGALRLSRMVENSKLEEIAIKVCEAINSRNAVSVQLFVDKNEQIYIIEVNIRFNGSITLGVAAGLDVFYWTLLECENIDLAQYPFIKSPKKLSLVRHAHDYIF